MKKIYFRFRVLLMTLTLGLASVFTISGSLQSYNEIDVDLPQVQSVAPIIVFPENDRFYPSGGAGGGIVKCDRKPLKYEEMKEINRLTENVK